MNKKRDDLKPKIATCKSAKCKFKSTDNGYCGKHQTEYRKLTIEQSAGKKVCVNHIHGCWSLLDKNDKFSRCLKCRESEREKDLARRNKTKTVNMNNVNTDKQYCSTCTKQFPTSAFIGVNGQQVSTCATCREANKRADQKRSGRSRNWTQEMKNNPERKAKKEEWKANNNDKMTQYYMNHRANKINEKGVEQVNAHNAKVAKQWRDNNKDRVIAINEEKRLNPDQRYKFYKHRAENMRTEWLFTFDEFKQMISNKCHYCGCKEEGEWNGIDRKNNNVGYTKENCVTCCTMCNMMKGEIEYDRFYKMVMHIVSNLMLCELKHMENNSNQFKNSFSSLLKFYKDRASRKNIPFLLTDEQFNIIRTMNCYLCNKPTNSNHLNGIDRIDSKKGYDLENCVPCCAGCNYLKKEYDIDDFTYKLYMIYCKYKSVQCASKQYVRLLVDTGGKLYEVNKYLEYKSKTKNTCKYTEDQLTIFLNRYYGMCSRAHKRGKKEKEIICRNILNAINSRKFDELENLLMKDPMFLETFGNNKENHQIKNQRESNYGKIKLSSMTADERKEYNKIKKQQQRERDNVDRQQKLAPKSATYRKQKQRLIAKMKAEGIEPTEEAIEQRLANNVLVDKSKHSDDQNTEEETRRKNALRKRKQREKERNVQKGITLTKLEFEEHFKQIDSKPKKLTQEEIRERDRLRKQKQREEKVKKYNDKDYIKLHSYENALKNAIKYQHDILIEKYKRLIEEFKKKHN